MVTPSTCLYVGQGGGGGVWLVSTLGLKVRDIGAAVPLLLPGTTVNAINLKKPLVHQCLIFP